MLGALTKAGLSSLIVVAYSDDSYSLSKKVDSLTVHIDFKTIKNNYEINYTKDDVQGQSEPELVFNKMGPKSLSMDLIFDTSGLLDAVPSLIPTSVLSKIEAFQSVAMDYNGDIHRPNYLWLFWGQTSFKGVLTKMDVTYTMFAPGGYPTRARVSVTFEESIPASTSSTEASMNSPDMTHRRMAVDGITLLHLSEEIYTDPKYYPEIARHNDLDQFRRLKPGIVLEFPPLEQ